MPNDLDQIALDLNRSSQKILDFQTPADFERAVALTVEPTAPYFRILTPLCRNASLVSRVALALQRVILVPVPPVRPCVPLWAAL